MGDELRRVAPDVAALVAGRDPRLLGRRRQPRAQRLGEPRPRDRAGARGGRTRLRRRRARRRRDCGGSRRLHRRRRAARAPHASRRGVPGGRLAPPRLAPRARDGAREVGVGRGSRRPVERSRRLPRPGRRHRRARLGRGGRVVRRPDDRRTTYGSSRERPTRSVVSARSTTVPSLSRTSQARPRERPRSRIFARPTSTSFDCSPNEGSRSTTTATACTTRTRSTRASPARATAGSRSRGCCSRPPPTLDIDLARSWMIGDADIDVEAGRGAGCRTILVENPRSSASPTRRRPRRLPGAGRRAGASTIVDERDALSMLESISTKIFADGADLDQILRARRRPADQGLHDEPDPDVEGGPDRLRRVRAGASSSGSPTSRSRSRSSPTTPDEIGRQARVIATLGRRTST